MNIALRKYPVNHLGPGNRYCIWTYGCKKNCKNCMASFSNYKFRKNETVDDIINDLEIVKSSNIVDGVTISGGEPFDQNDLFELLKRLKDIGIADVLVYTGYYLEEMSLWYDYLPYIDVLIDGPYIDELNDNKPLRGSSNQRVFIFNESLKYKYDEYLNGSRNYDIIINNDGFLVVGILPMNGLKDIKEVLKIKGE